MIYIILYILSGYLSWRFFTWYTTTIDEEDVTMLDYLKYFPMVLLLGPLNIITIFVAVFEDWDKIAKKFPGVGRAMKKPIHPKK